MSPCHRNLTRLKNKPRRLHSDTILSMSTITKSYLKANSNYVMDGESRVKTTDLHGRQ